MYNKFHKNQLARLDVIEIQTNLQNLISTYPLCLDTFFQQ